MDSAHDDLLARAEAAERERDELRRRAEESEALNVLALAANRTLDPDEVLTVVARLSRTLLGAHYVTVNLLEGEVVRVAAAVGVRGAAREVADPVAAAVIAGGKPILLDDQNRPANLHSLPFHEGEGMRAVLAVPLALFGETFGALVIGYRRAYLLQSRDTRLALTLASHATVAISNARLHRALAGRSTELERAYEELRWTTQAKERFFASMSHELRTPLNAILGYHELLLEGITGEIPDQARPYLANANRATRTLLHLVNDLLDLSRLEVGRMELLPRPARAADLVDDAVNTVRPMAHERGLRLRVSVPPRLRPIVTDAHRVHQILVNLLSNAVKFTERGRVEVTVAESITLPEGEAEGWQLEIRVADTGVGIAPDDLERIFHEFEQVSGASALAGTGLGLPIARRLARLLGGDLTVQSELGAGSVFTLRLPARLPAAEGTPLADPEGTARG